MRRLAILAVVLALPVSVGMVRLQTARSAPPVGKAATELPKPDPALRELIGFRVRYRDLLKRRIALVPQVRIGYTAWDGARRTAVLVLPKWYGPGANPAIPLVISPHGRGGTAQANARLNDDGTIKTPAVQTNGHALSTFCHAPFESQV